MNSPRNVARLDLPLKWPLNVQQKAEGFLFTLKFCHREDDLWNRTAGITLTSRLAPRLELSLRT